ncbi:TlpA disulfide reductase family protein [Paraflavitalea speifideaquila]|uniref:TlpA family protein disulfide reductase n=1 Tax=Paraflavitalea speifideaquila TaxID=3076558 RepID=UPI0028F0E9C8|nr:TlpA disulfide reductase family protein [Paraflavitalea speifideiaquila]
MNVTIGEGNYQLTGKNSNENLALASWHQHAATVEETAVYLLRGKSATFKEFFPQLESFTGSLAGWQPAKTGNAPFDEDFARRRKADVLSWAIGFITSPNSVHPTAEDYTAYYQSIKAEDYTRDGYLLRYPMGVRLVSFLPMVEDMVAGHKLNMQLDERLSRVLNDTLRGEMVLQNASGLKTYLGYQDLDKNYGKFILTADQQRRLSDIKAKLARESSKPGAAGIDFTYPDLDGKKVSLTDFKGKVVLVDVWATWCGPCKGEIPHLKKMEEEMRGKDIVFMSVSVDEQKDHQKWKDYIAKEALKGVQLFAAGWSDIARNYDIKGIPRFMVFDKKGILCP